MSGVRRAVASRGLMERRIAPIRSPNIQLSEVSTAGRNDRFLKRHYSSGVETSKNNFQSDHEVSSSDTANDSSTRSNSIPGQTPGHKKNAPSPAHFPQRPWREDRLPMNVRVQRFVETELGELDGPAIIFDALPLVDQCCRMQNFEGMKLAHDILDRSLAEKQFFDEQKNDTDNKNNYKKPFDIPNRLFKNIIYAWGNLADKSPIAHVRMRETLDAMIRVVEHDEKLLHKLESEKHGSTDARKIDHNPHGRFRVDTDIYNTFLLGLRNAARNYRPAAASVVAVLDEMVQKNESRGWHTKPNTKSYTMVISALARSKYEDAGIRAEKVLRRMQKAHDAEKQAYFEQYGEQYNTADSSVNKRRIPTADVVVYNGVITAYSKSRSLLGARKARDLLIEVITKQDSSVQADFALFTGVISAYASVAENPKIAIESRLQAAKDAEAVLEMMLADLKEVIPSGSNVSPFNGKDRDASVLLRQFIVLVLKRLR